MDFLDLTASQSLRVNCTFDITDRYQYIKTEILMVYTNGIWVCFWLLHFASCLINNQIELNIYTVREFVNVK